MCCRATGPIAAQENAAPTQSQSAVSDDAFIDLSLLVAPTYPTGWPAPTFPPFHLQHDARIGALSPYNRDTLAIDENTGTQFDAPAHSVPPPDSKYPDAGSAGLVTGDRVPAWQLIGEACVVDCTDLCDAGAPGRSALVTRQRIEQWEKEHRALSTGDAVLFRSDYSDKYYRPMPKGVRFVAAPVDERAPAWPDPDPGCVAYLAGRRVMTLATDSPSMGPLPKEIAAETHLVGLRQGMCWVESGTNFGKLPAMGACFCLLPIRHVGGAGAETRALAITDPALARRLIAGARNRQVADLSVTLDEDLPCTWTGAAAGQHRPPYLRKVLISWEQSKGKSFAQTHYLDSQCGTHLVPGSFALPTQGFDRASYSPEVQGWLRDYESRFGACGASDQTTERVPLGQTCGEARVIDVRARRGTAASTRPSSPVIRVEDIEAFERARGALRAGDVVLFSCGWTDEYYKPLPAGDDCLAAPLSGRREGWPALGAEAVVYLAKKGIRCVGTDCPSLGGVDPREALMTYWALGSRGMVAVEFLTNLAEIAGRPAYFLFAATKIEGCHGGPGRAIAVY
ncbi:MAG: cyclase family protein [Pirellulales bacterium]|nr:cyclase family protein [Pirellulales bacterium]